MLKDGLRVAPAEGCPEILVEEREAPALVRECGGASEYEEGDRTELVECRASARGRPLSRPEPSAAVGPPPGRGISTPTGSSCPPYGRVR